MPADRRCCFSHWRWCFSLLGLALVFADFNSVAAFLRFRIKFPNGERIPHVCDRRKTWQGVGHENPFGFGTLNVFGADFLRANKTWSHHLCRRDSDGDGLTNGQELGDPDCVWSEGDRPAISTADQLSHPGICEPINAAVCLERNKFLRDLCPEQQEPGEEINMVAASNLVVSCIPPSSPQNAHITGVSLASFNGQYLEGDYFQFQCNEGYGLVGSPAIYCKKEGRWTEAPRCSFLGIETNVASCPSPRNMPFNAYPVVTPTPQKDGRYSAGSLFQYDCLHGYDASGYGTIACLRNGAWSRASLKCVRNRQALIGVHQSSNRNSLYDAHAALTNPNGPTCILPCPMPKNVIVKSGVKAEGTYSPGDVLTLDCCDGYVGQGCNFIMCQDNGNFTTVSYTCRRSGVSCPRPHVPTNAQVQGSALRESYSPGETVTFACNSGFNSTTGSSAISMCQQDGTWAGCTLVCQQVGPQVTVCPVPQPPTNAHTIRALSQPINGNRYINGDTIFYECDQGFTPSGTSQITCQDNATWTQLTFTCTVTGCPSPVVPLYAFMKIPVPVPGTNQKFIAGDKVVWDCNEGYRAAGTAEITCQLNGTWIPNNFSCSQETCPEPRLTNGVMIVGGPGRSGFQYTEGDRLILGCIEGFDTTGGIPQMTCLAGGQWSMVNFTCGIVVRKCLQPQLPANACIVGGAQCINGQYNEGDTVILGCVSNDYTPSGTRRITCLQGGNWTLTDFSCTRRALNCSRPDLPNHSLVLVNSRNQAERNPLSQFFSPGEYVQYGCQSGYTILGTVRCQSDGSWSGNSMSCQPLSRAAVAASQPSNGALAGVGVTCPNPRAPRNAVPVTFSSSNQPQTYFVDDFIQYTCGAGSPTGVLTCLRDGTWSASIFTCRSANAKHRPNKEVDELTKFRLPTLGSPNEVYCPTPKEPKNGQIVAQSVSVDGSTYYPFGSFFVFICSDGYNMMGDATIICGSDGEWSTTPICVKTFMD